MGELACTLDGHLSSFLVPTSRCRHQCIALASHSRSFLVTSILIFPWVIYFLGLRLTLPYSSVPRYMTVLAKVPSLVYATIASPKAGSGPYTATSNMSNNRQNVTWVEVCCSLPAFESLLTWIRVCEESLHSGLSSHIFAERGTTACGRRAITKMRHHNFFNYLSYDYRGKDELELPCLLSSLDMCAQSNHCDKPNLDRSQLPW